MNFGDIFKKSFLNAINTGDISMKIIILSLLMACLFAAYIFIVYRIVTRKTFYSKNFAMSLALNAIIVAAIIITIQSNLVVSLGMVGALSIIRFRTAIKDPMDLTFLFWSICVGIICGTGLMGIAVIVSFLITIGILIMNFLPVARAPWLLIINADDMQIRKTILEEVAKYTNGYTVKSQVVEKGRIDMIIEIRTSQADALIDSITKLSEVKRCSLLSHDGEVTF